MHRLRHRASRSRPRIAGHHTAGSEKLLHPHKDYEKTTPFSLLLQPFQWLQMLSHQLNTSFVVGIFLVYGLSQGFSGSFFRVVTDYYWKDVQKVQPSEVQLYMGLYYIPWVMKPVWGLLTDVFPVRGYHRRPYFVLAGVLGTVAALVVALSGKLAVGVALVCLVGITAAMAIADVTIDACIARNSIEFRSLAPDMQSLCGFVPLLGALGLLAIPPASVIGLGLVIYELKTNAVVSSDKNNKVQAVQKLGGAIKGMYQTIQIPQVWKPSLYMYLSLALSISTHEGQFYWYTNPKLADGPAFSQEFVGMIYAIGALASIVGVLIYHKLLKDYPFRKLLFFAQLLFGLTGMLDLIFILRLNKRVGVPDSFFVITEECVSRIVTRIRWIPMIVLSTRLCPLGIEGTFFALLMCIDSFGSLTNKWGGGMVLHIFHVTRTDFSNLWLVVLIRNILRLATLSFIFLIPNVDPSETIIPADLLGNAIKSGGDEDADNLQLVPFNEEDEV
ncbi:hypothetical protein C3L33_08988, partial [Rhododendron williamsianum]